MKQIKLFATIFLFFSLGLLAEIPSNLSWQGVISDDEGNLLEGTYDVTLKLYNLESGGSALWSETQSINIENGYVNIILGEVSALNLDFDEQYWLEIKFGEGEPLSRIKLTYSPYSMFAVAISDNSVNSNKIEDGTIAGTDLSQMGASSGQVLKWNGSTWAPDVESIPAISLNDLSDAKSDNQSIFIGDSSGINDDGDNRNVAIGKNTLQNNTSGYYNIGIGYNVLKENTTGYRNIAIGRSALTNQESGDNNIGIGNAVLYNNSTGDENIAIGTGSMYNNTIGENNVAVGLNSLKRNVSGNSNIAIGSDALFANKTGSDNIAFGEGALDYNETGNSNIAIGIFSQKYSSSSNSNISIGNNSLKASHQSKILAIGDSSLFNNARYLDVENDEGIQNVAIGHKSQFENVYGSYNTALGFESLRENKNGDHNTAVGTLALANGTETLNTAVGSWSMASLEYGFNNTAIGAYSLGFADKGDNNTALGQRTMMQNTTGDENTAVGSGVLFSNTSGNYNSALGAFALSNNEGGDDNVAIGHNSMLNNSEGDRNVAIGLNAMQSNDDGGNNTGIGSNVLYYNLASNNTATGSKAMFENTTGTLNTADGYFALLNNKTGGYNTAIGAGAGSLVTGNNYCTFLGYDAENKNSTSRTNSMALGYNARISANNQVRIGNTSVTSIGGYVGWTNLSDERYKLNVTENIPGLEFISKLRPVSYKIDINKINTALNDTSQIYQEKVNTVYTGFIAQEVETAAKSIGFDFSGVDEPKNEDDMYGLRYAEFVVPLVKAVQEQQEIIDEQNRKIEELENKLNQILQKIE